MLCDEFVEAYRSNEVKGPVLAGPGAGRPAQRCATRRSATWRVAAAPRTSHALVRALRASTTTPPTKWRRFRSLAQLRSPERAKALERFYERWKDDHLVIDTWFSYQAVSPLASALASVKKLTRHPLFSIKNPNKVRALIGTFAHGQSGELQPAGWGGLRVRGRPGARTSMPSTRRSRRGCCPHSAAGRRWSRSGARLPRRPCSASPRRSRCRTTCSRSCRRCWSSLPSSVQC